MSSNDERKDTIEDDNTIVIDNSKKTIRVSRNSRTTINTGRKNGDTKNSRSINTGINSATMNTRSKSVNTGRKNNGVPASLTNAVKKRLANDRGCDVEELDIKTDEIANSIANVVKTNRSEFSSLPIINNQNRVGKKQLRQDYRNASEQRSIYDLLALTTELETIFSKKYDLELADSDNKDAVDKQIHHNFESSEQQKQNEIIKMLSNIPAVDNWLTIVKTVLFLCSKDCPEFLDPKTTKLSAMENIKIIRGGFKERAKPITVIKLLVHNYKNIFATAINSSSTSKNRMSIQQLIKNIYVTPHIFDADNTKTMICWYLCLSRHTSCFSNYYKSVTQ